jgi:hypothetical protein
MSVATLVAGALKTRQPGAREAERPSVELPEKTARGRLVTKLSEFERACSELDDYKARAERARIDADRAMEDSQLSETEAAERIQTFQLQGNVYKARQGQREKAIATLSGELTTAIGQAGRELQGLVNREVDRRREIIGARVLEVAGATDSPFPGLNRRSRIYWTIQNQFCVSRPWRLARYFLFREFRVPGAEFKRRAGEIHSDSRGGSSEDMSTLSDEVKVVRAANPSWDFQTAWDHIAKTQPWRFSKSVEMNRLEAKLAPQKEEEAREKFAKVESIARRLMQRNSKLTFGAALEITRTCLPGVQAEMADLLRQSVKTEEPKTYLVESIETGRQLDFGEES